MAPRFTNLMYQVYPSDHGADALVCFPFAQSEFISPFRDKLTEALLRDGDIKVNRVQGYPLPPDSTFRFYSEKHAKLVEEFFQKKRPSFLSRLMNSAKWASFQKEKRAVGKMIDVEIETSHDFPCVIVHSRIHSEESDLPPKYVPLSMLVPPAGIGKVGTQPSQAQVVDSPRSCAV